MGNACLSSNNWHLNHTYFKILHIILISVLFSLPWYIIHSDMFSFSCFQLFQEIGNANRQFLLFNGRFKAKRLNNVFGNKFKYTNILETQCPSNMYNNRIPNFIKRYNITILQNSFLLSGFIESRFRDKLWRAFRHPDMIEMQWNIRMKHMRSLKYVIVKVVPQISCLS